MISISDLKKKFYFRAIQKALQNKKKTIACVDFKNARSVGILFDATQIENHSIVFNFYNTLKSHHIEVELLGFMASKQDYTDVSFNYINKKSVDWKGLIRKGVITGFIENPFDVLICLHNNVTPPLEHIAALSNAKSKIGPYTEQINDYDLMIDTKQKNNFKTLIKQILFFLSLEITEKKKKQAKFVIK